MCGPGFRPQIRVPRHVFPRVGAVQKAKPVQHRDVQLPLQMGQAKGEIGEILRLRQALAPKGKPLHQIGWGGGGNIEAHLEGGGGGNAGESYNLAYAFAGMRTAHDALEKRNQKGFLFTIGDEPCLPHLTSIELRETMDEPTQKTFSTDELMKLASDKYHIYHLLFLHLN